MKRRTPAICTAVECASPTIKKTKVQAQRKFAQGCNNYVYPSAKILPKPTECDIFPSFKTSQRTGISKNDKYELNNFSSVPTIDDFLTFLCFRETEVLPERLNYLNTPQFKVLPSKKSLKSTNAVKDSVKEYANNRVNGKPPEKQSKSFFKKKNTAEYKLRTRNPKSQNTVYRSHYLTLKHNQRLRSKSVVKAKFCENKLHALIETNTVKNKSVPCSTKAMKVGHKCVSGRPLTRLGDKSAFTKPSIDDDRFRRVTRRNSILNDDSRAPDNFKPAIPSRNPNKRNKVPDRNSDNCATKPFTKSLSISLPKIKSEVTNVIMEKRSASTSVTRNTRSNSVLEEVPSTPVTSTRPSRRTKEAATLYMEMLGKDLLCPDECFDDDDDVSVESFPELPNTEEHIRREKELKEMHHKKITETLPIRRTNSPKRKSSVKSSVSESSKLSNQYQKSPDKERISQTDLQEPENVSGLCTRSKQYNTEPSQKQTVKIIRTLIKNNRNLGCRRRNSCGVFSKSKHVTNISPKELGGSKIRGEDRKADTTTKSVTIKKLSTMKPNRKKAAGNGKNNNCKFQENVNELLSRRVSESKIVAKVKDKTVKSSGAKINEKTDSSESEKELASADEEFDEDDEYSYETVTLDKRILARSNFRANKNNASDRESELVQKMAIAIEKEQLIKKIVEMKSKRFVGSNDREETNRIKNRTESSSAKSIFLNDGNENGSQTAALMKPTLSDSELEEMKKYGLAPNFHVCDVADVSSTNDCNMLGNSAANRNIASNLEARSNSVPQKIPASGTNAEIPPRNDESVAEANNLIQMAEINSSRSNVSEKLRNKSNSLESLLNDDEFFSLENLEGDFSVFSESEIFQLFEETNDDFRGFEASVSCELSDSELNKVGECTDSSQNSQQEAVTSTKNADLKEPDQHRPIFSDTKSTTAEKPVMQTTVSSNNKKFNAENKKVIFSKTDSPVSTKVTQETNSCKSKAFSPDNENSVYAFEPDLPTTSPPFRRIKPVPSPAKSIVSNSIALQVNFEKDAKLECSSSEETQVSSTTDCNDRVFYIPIQTPNSTSTLGVAVKLDTVGPNQKIIMSATLITNTSTFTTNTHSTISTKASNIDTSCTQTAAIKLSTAEHVTEIAPSLVTKGTTETIVSSADVQTIEIPCNSTASPPKIKKNVLPVKAPAQSVRIVKLNKSKKLQNMKTASTKEKPQHENQKCAEKLIENVETKEKVPSTPADEILDAPTFYPNANEFSDPLEYIESIRSVAEKYGLCRIVPPSDFRPECKVDDEMRFTAYNHYIHKLWHRWGPNVKEMMAIKKFLITQNITLNQAPCIGGMEIDLPRLYKVVQQCGGLKAVIERERWHQVADVMKIPKLAQDRITKLDDIYCKYLLPYDILSHGEREKLFEEIEKEWQGHLNNTSDNEVFDDIDECIVKGRTMPLSSFYRIARNTMLMCFGNEGPTIEKIEEEFWNYVSKRESHICVHSGSIDSGTYGYGFSMAKNSTSRKHPWNLKVLTNNSASILRSLGPVMGITVPTLHVGMLYSACCWYRDPHGLPWIEYLHTGASKIWYGIPDAHSDRFKEAMLLLVPRFCRDKKLWLPSDTVMIPPHLLSSHNVSLSRVVQHPGQFIVVFPKAFTSSISTGYHVSESVYFAHTSWLNSAKKVFMDMQNSCEPSVFSLEQLLISVADDNRPNVQILNKVLALLIDLRDTEVASRSQLKRLGLNASEKLNINKKRKSKGAFSEEDNYECETCRANLFVSLVINSHQQSNYCLKHAVTLLSKKPTQVKYCKLMYAYTEDELDTFVENVKSRIEAKSNKKPQAK